MQLKDCENGQMNGPTRTTMGKVLAKIGRSRFIYQRWTSILENNNIEDWCVSIDWIPNWLDLHKFDFIIYKHRTSALINSDYYLQSSGK